MTFQDKVSYWIASLEYVVGTWIARILLHRVGSGSRVHVSVRYWSPSRIWIGANCEIRHGTFLDARSSKDIAVRIGDGSRIKDYVAFATYGGEIQLGKNVLVGRCSTIFGHGGVYIGNSTMISPHTMIISTDHLAYLSSTPFQEQGFTREPIHIGENVWIGANACILAGTTIAANVVVGAGAVVSGDLAGGWLYGGIPAEPIKPLDVHKPEDPTVYARDWDLLD